MKRPLSNSTEPPPTTLLIQEQFLGCLAKVKQPSCLLLLWLFPTSVLRLNVIISGVQVNNNALALSTKVCSCDMIRNLSSFTGENLGEKQIIYRHTHKASTISMIFIYNCVI